MANTILHQSRAALLLVVCGAVTGAGAAGPNGLWVLNLGPRTLLILSITAPPASGRSISGWLSQPSNFQTDGWSFSQVTRPVKTRPIIASSWHGAVLSITVQDPANLSHKDTLLFTLKNETQAQLRIAGLSLPPLELIRAHGTPVIATDWDKAKTYSPDDGAVSNPEMKRIFEEDQRVRPAGVKIDWTSVNKSDAGRREATRKLLKADALHTGEDFTWAAFVFQHGSAPSDFLLAHTLAIIALQKGYGRANWIAAATLDRYLQSVHQSQIYGTQFPTPKGRPTTQEPYDRGLVSDTVRRRLGVPIQSEQDEQRKQYDRQRASGK
jgi:hypothetical protein